MNRLNARREVVQLLKRQHKLNFVSVATKNYLSYWKNQAQSIDKHLSPDTACTILLFTDQEQEAQEFAQSLLRVSVSTVSIPSYGWPEATLNRYKLISEHGLFWQPSDVLIYLDADMLVVDEIGFGDFSDARSTGVTLVQHPGFFRPKGPARLFFYLKNLEFAIRDLVTKVSYGGLGTWETRRRSLAFVRRKLRHRYFCGGIWWGPAGEIAKLCNTLAYRIEKDSEEGVTAVWHDESHLNWWATQNSHFSETPEYCFSEVFPTHSGLSPKVIAVSKSASD